ncbi:multitransmembrane protein [Elysia marginata]|uniref:Multitransmembrane protein n=1 Tax=Elysia marginata TaxID=1093978 RepID=A0AAV4EAV2_9GAST|nr:multitransmembrane protein [Elysia marginata]
MSELGKTGEAGQTLVLREPSQLVQLTEQVEMDEPAAPSGVTEILVFKDTVITSLTIAVYGFSALASIIVMMVFWKDGLRSTSNISFFALSIADLLTSLFGISGEVINNVMPQDAMNDAIGLMVLYFFPWVETFYAVGSWITAIITWERLWCIAFPLKVRSVFTVKLVTGLIVGGFVYLVIGETCFLLGLHYRIKGSREAIYVPWFDEVGRLRLNMTNTETMEMGTSMVYYGRMLGYNIPRFVLNVAVAIGTVLLVVAFLRRIRTKRALTESKTPQKLSDREKRLIQSVIAVCLIYIVTSTPATVVDTVAMINNSLIAPMTQLFLGSLFNLIQSLNHGVNIFIYLAANVSFRNHFKNMFRVCVGEERVTAR